MPKTSGIRSVVQRPGFWGIIIAGVLVVAGVVITLLNSLIYNAESAVEDYVEALRAGEGETALALSQGYLSEDAPASISTVLLDGDGLAASTAFLEDAEIVAVDADVPESYRDDELTQQVVEIRYTDAEDNTRATSLVVDNVSTSWLFFNEWEMHPMPLQQVELAPEPMPADATADAPVAQVHGQSTPLLGEGDEPATLAAFAPSLIELEYQGTYLEATAPQHYAVTDLLAAGASAEFSFDVELTPAVDEAITQEVQQQLERCTEQTVLKPAGCPFGYETANRVVPNSVSWSLDVPDVEYSWNGSEPEIDWIMATAVLDAQEIDIGSGEQSATEYEEVFEMSADLELTPENLRVAPNWQ
ncbi:hypothetical protein GCM10009720_20390 [Yaniella flava]|uniref:Uncharacterized protein n=1 Tax=Yaniella flava TaxID=287930 RepID=A0ABP5G570_9MICC|nr:hypothetical protein [Micrococcaceae bacterium]